MREEGETKRSLRADEVGGTSLFLFLFYDTSTKADPTTTFLC